MRFRSAVMHKFYAAGLPTLGLIRLGLLKLGLLKLEFLTQIEPAHIVVVDDVLGAALHQHFT